jgi:hypothetical protein
MEGRYRRVVEALYDDESLRSHLADDEAKDLLEWAAQVAMAWVDTTASQPEDGAALEAIAVPLARLRSVVRRINNFVGERGRLAPQDMLVRLQEIVPVDQQRALWSLVAQAHTWSNREIITHIVHLVDRDLRPIVSHEGDGHR